MWARGRLSTPAETDRVHVSLGITALHSLAPVPRACGTRPIGVVIGNVRLRPPLKFADNANRFAGSILADRHLAERHLMVGIEARNVV